MLLRSERFPNASRLILDFYAASVTPTEVIQRVESSLAHGIIGDTFEIGFPIGVK
jgi:hypothetical protein